MVEVSEKFNLQPKVCNATVLLIVAKIRTPLKLTVIVLFKNLSKFFLKSNQSYTYLLGYLQIN